MIETHIPTTNIPLKYKQGVNFQHVQISQLSAATNRCEQGYKRKYHFTFPHPVLNENGV